MKATVPQRDLSLLQILSLISLLSCGSGDAVLASAESVCCWIAVLCIQLNGDGGNGLIRAGLLLLGSGPSPRFSLYGSTTCAAPAVGLSALWRVDSKAISLTRLPPRHWEYGVLRGRARWGATWCFHVALPILVHL